MTEAFGSAAAVGRAEELERIEQFTAGGSGARALLLIGDPGVGKTTLLDAAVAAAQARGHGVLQTRPSEREISLSFVNLADLLERVEIGALEDVPGPQRRALEVAALRADPDGAAPELLVVSAGLTAALRALTHAGPVLVAVDDVPWLDPMSAAALAYAAHRLDKAPVRFVLARRPGRRTALERSFGATGIESLAVGPLSLGAIRSLLAERLGLTLPRRVLVGVFETSGGNPLFALELARAIAEHGRPEIGAELPVPDTLDELFRHRLARVPEPARRALLATALAGPLSRDELSQLVGADAVEDALELELLEPDGERVRGAHPLLLAAVRHSATARERRALHGELGRTLTEDGLRAKHLALAGRGTDPVLAAATAAAAEAALARGAAHDAVQLSEQALRLTPAGSEHATRVLELARRLVIAGEMARARRAVTEEIADLPAGPALARAFLILGECADTVGEWHECVDRAIVESGGDPSVLATALATKSVVLAATLFRELAEAARLAQEARALASVAGDPQLERWAACSLAWVRLLRGEPFDDLADGFPAPPRGASLYESALERIEATRLVTRGELAGARALFQHLRALAEERGEARSGMIMHLGLCEIELRAGDALAAAPLVDECEEWLAFEESDELLVRPRAFLALVRGDADEARRGAEETIAAAERVGMERERLEGMRIRGLAALLAHDPERAVTDLLPIWERMRAEGIDEPGVFPLAADLVEALLAVDDRERAEAVLARLDFLAERQAHPWALIDAQRCRALLRHAEDREADRADSELAEAADRYAALGLLHDSARSLLLLGRSQRRRRRWGRARTSLEAAAAAFDSAGAAGWAAEARAELSRVGGRRAAPAGRLTATEQRIAELAAAGFSNKEIAARLVVSPHTVEKHLSHTYAKLGVTSRAQLTHRLHAP